MTDLYSQLHRQLQDLHDTRNLADRVQELIVENQINEQHQPFIESRDFFFLTTIDHRGYPTCSYKGGNPGLVRVVDPQTLAFPSYDGNGMFLSMGNIQGNPKIGMLFIDFETPHRIRVHGEASIQEDDSLLSKYPGADMIVRVKIGEIFINCPRYIHRMQRIETSKYVPQPDNETPIPQWKRIDAIQDALPASEQGLAEKLGGTITPEEYGEKVMKGEG
ncbi:pyridoxamine 5'-phosphate oxidase family protein [Methylotuvimicrobium sp. KM2]|uniref:pyridoxamine 5'-phosphate oxidase family protein n=1 Tax=Methylotuvimicrobium sp. KM2 TaxID=3133976 RepID=UPI0031017394